ARVAPAPFTRRATMRARADASGGVRLAKHKMSGRGHRAATSRAWSRLCGPRPAVPDQDLSGGHHGVRHRAGWNEVGWGRWEMKRPWVRTNVRCVVAAVSAFALFGISGGG